MHVPAAGNVSAGHLSSSCCVASGLKRSAYAAHGTRPSLDSRISTPVSALRLIFVPGTERCLRSRPLRLTAAYEDPPSAMNTASVDITLA